MSENRKKSSTRRFKNFRGTKRRIWIASSVAVVLMVLAVTGVLYALKQGSGMPTGKAAEEYGKQLPELEEKVKEDPDDATARRDYAVALRATGDMEASKEQYEEAVKLNDQDATVWNNLGNVYRDLGNYDKAVDAYRKAIDLNGKQLNLYANLANVQLYQLEKSEDAIATYEKGLQALPGNETLQLQLALAYERTGEKQKAQKILEEILKKNEKNQAAEKILERVKE